MNNEFNINAVKVVKTTAGDHLYIRLVEISCPTWLSATIKHKNLAQQCARLVANCRKPTNRAIPQNYRFQKVKHQNLKRCSPTMHQNPTNKVKTLRDSKTSSPKLLNTFPSGLIHGTIKCIWIRMGIKEHTENCDVWSKKKLDFPSIINPQRFQLQQLWWPADCIIITVIVVIVIIIIIAIFNFKNDPSIQSK